MRPVITLALLAACGAAESSSARSPEQRGTDSAPAVAALVASKFPDAERAATSALALDPRNARAAAVQAIALYRNAGHELIVGIEKTLDRAEKHRAFDHPEGRAVWTRFLSALGDVDRALAVVAADPDFSLELCLACWEHDWNRSGEIDERDRKMFELEVDANGNEFPEGDPRRRPTYRFDVGDAEWARAMIAFQRAAVELILAYQWTELDKLFLGGSDKITIRLGDTDRVRHAHQLILAGLDHAERCRAAYLAESDDDREWVPSPRQKSYAMPLTVDAKLYDTWLGILGDVRRMLKSEEGISLREAQGVAELDDFRLPDAFIDLGAMLRSPKDIVIDLRNLSGKPNIEGVLRNLLGNGYRKSMKRSPIVSRLRRMKEELSRGEDTFERKLRYMLWLN